MPSILLFDQVLFPEAQQDFQDELVEGYEKAQYLLGLGNSVLAGQKENPQAGPEVSGGFGSVYPVFLTHSHVIFFDVLPRSWRPLLP